MPEDPAPPRPVVAQYVATFLKPEMWHIYRQIRALRAVRPVVFCQKRENQGQFPFEPVHVLSKPRTHQLRRLWQKTICGRPITMYRSEARRLLRALQTAEAQLLHVYFGHIGVHLLPLLEQAELPVILSFHGADAQVDHESAVYQELSRRVLAQVRLVLVRSASIAARVEALGCAPGKIRLHRTGVPLEEIEFTQRQAPADGAWHFVQACRLIAKKGLRTTLRAFAAVRERFTKARLTIAGEGPLLAEAQALAAELGVAEAVHFPGFLSQPDLRAIFARAHVFLHPSELGPNGDQEGVPNSMLEAMASGLPVGATWHGGIPEAVEDGRSGVLVREGDHAALAGRLLELLPDGARYESMGRAASDRVRAEFDLAAQARVLEQHYAEAMAPERAD